MPIASETLNVPSSIPGLTMTDVFYATPGMNPGGHSIHDPNDERLLDPTLQARVAYWLRPKAYSLKELKGECKARQISMEGNKRVLALKLALRKLPQKTDMLDGLLSTTIKAGDDIGTNATSEDKGGNNNSKQTEKPKKNIIAKKKTITKTKYPPSFQGCKTCGNSDHNKCTKLKCPLHPDYEKANAGDWSGRPGHKCQLCGRSSEGVGPRRGFDYRNDVCGGCTDLSEL
ncbi:hypothetical protein ACHAXM_001701 [Skeletonema potamos]